MRAVVSDFDGILVETERAKAIGWYAAVKGLKGELADGDFADLCALNSRGRSVADEIIAELSSCKNAVLTTGIGDMHRLVGDKLPRLGPDRMAELHGRSRRWATFGSRGMPMRVRFRMSTGPTRRTAST